MYTNWYQPYYKLVNAHRCQNITEHDRIRYWWKYIGCHNYSTWKIRSKIYFLKRRKSIARTKERSVICQHSCLIMMRTSTMLGILKVPYSRWFWVLYLTRTHSLSRRMIRFDAQAFEQILPVFFEMPKVWH